MISNNNTIIIGSKNTMVVALGNGAAPGYSKGSVFVIDGLINPTLVVPKGTSVLQEHYQ
jgi:hypothetical protein